MSKKKAKPRQSLIFENGEELPLFTGTLVKATDEKFEPKPAPKQGKLFGPPTFDELVEGRVMPDWLQPKTGDKPTVDWLDSETGD